VAFLRTANRSLPRSAINRFTRASARAVGRSIFRNSGTASSGTATRPQFFTRLALSRPGLHFTLRHKGKLVHEVPASANLKDRIGLFFGKDVGGSLYAVEAENGPIKLSGFIANPACERGNAQMQYFFVNGRWVRDRSLGHAVQEAYRGLLMTGRYAVAFLFLDVPTGQVDVNVHPTKVEVRLQDSQTFYRLVLHAVRSRLQREDLTARLRGPELSSAVAEGQLMDPALPFVGTTHDRHHTYHGSSLPTARMPSASSTPRMTGPSPSILAPWEIQGPSGETPHDHRASPPGPQQTAIPSEPFKGLQLYNTYLVVETPDGLLVIDQHALHERILFEELRSRLRSGPLETQRLLIPEPVEFPADQAALALESQEALASLGLGLEEFGGGTLLLTTYPVILGKRQPQAILRAVVDYLVAKGRVPDREQLLHDVLSLMACHAAVRAGDALTPEQMVALLARQDLAADTHHCPHGRPTSLLFSRHDLERQFRRI
jgi:DNA mismatch repair protein MutL